jgi:hypothetical protein
VKSGRFYLSFLPAAHQSAAFKGEDAHMAKLF